MNLFDFLCCCFGRTRQPVYNPIDVLDDYEVWERNTRRDSVLEHQPSISRNMGHL